VYKISLSNTMNARLPQRTVSVSQYWAGTMLAKGNLAKGDADKRIWPILFEGWLHSDTRADGYERWPPEHACFAIFVLDAYFAKSGRAPESDIT
jgi:hypothetical protein